MSRPHPTATALLLGFSIFAIASAPQAGHRSEHGDSYDVAIFSDDDNDEQIVVIRLDHSTATGIEGVDDEARLLRGGDVDRASRRIRSLAKDQDVSLVDVDSEGTGQVTIIAEDDEDGASAYISIGEHGIEIHADSEDGDGIHLSFGDHRRDDSRGDAVRIHARSDDDSDRAVVLLNNLDAEATREFIDDLDDVPRALKREMLRELDL